MRSDYCIRLDQLVDDISGFGRSGHNAVSNIEDSQRHMELASDDEILIRGNSRVARQIDREPVGEWPESAQLATPMGRGERPLSTCAVTRRRFPVGARPTRRFAPAGSNASERRANSHLSLAGWRGEDVKTFCSW